MSTGYDELVAARVITCIVPVGHGAALVDALWHELSLTTVNDSRGRGASQRSGMVADEVDIVEVVVEAERADQVFAFLYERAEVGERPHRFMYQTALELATPAPLPQVPEEAQE